VQRRWKSDEGEKRPEVPFNLQLFESVTARVQKAKEEETRQAQLHQRTARGRFFATLFGNSRRYAHEQINADSMRSYHRH
jgi:D-lactate dehydrogenase (cytochrome)